MKHSMLDIIKDLVCLEVLYLKVSPTLVNNNMEAGGKTSSFRQVLSLSFCSWGR